MVSDYWAVPFLATMHRVAADAGGAGALALAAGIDVELPDTIGYGDGLIERVRRGEVPEELVDRAARRLLRQKAELGLLDPDWTPEASVADAGVDLDPPANRALAREMAERSVVLLDAADRLPLLGPGRPALRRVAAVGPCAADPRTFMGCYAFPNHVLPRHPGLGLGIEVPTAVDALRAELPGVEVAYEQGCAVQGDDRSGFAAAVAAARDADLCVAYVGDLAGLFGRGTSGEGCDAEDLRLPGQQADLLAELLATGTPLVVVVVSGRPYALGELAGRAALVQAFMPGEEGGAAVAGVLSGRVQPGGKLPVQIPRRPGGQPSTYLQPPLGSPESAGISPLDPTPLFPFGYGGSYTTFEVDDLRLDATEIGTDGEFGATVRVRNTGGRAGDEVVQLYLRGVLARVVRPVRQLAGFARVRLEPGEAPDVRFRVHADRTAFTDLDLARVVAPRRARGAGRDVGGRPALPRQRPDHRAAAGGGARPPAGHPGGARTGRGRRPGGREPSMRAEDAVDAKDAVDSRDSRATLATVAASAGVSVATVSKVLNGRSDVAPATRALVQDLLEEHDYVGRRADPGRLVTVELMFHGELNAYSLEVFEGILTTAGELGAAVAVSLRPRGDGKSAAARSGAWVRGLVAAGRQAVITVTSELPGSDLTALSRARIPVVVIDPFNLPRTKVTSVGSTNFTGGLSATRHLLELGHRRIAYVGGPAEAACNLARMQGYRAAMEAEGVPVPDGYVRYGRFHHSDGVVEGASLLELREPPTAVFAGSDETALGIIEAARSRRAAGAGGPQHRRLRRHLGRPVRLAAADHGPPAAARDRRGRAAPGAAAGRRREGRLVPRRARHRTGGPALHRTAGPALSTGPVDPQEGSE